MYVNNFFHLNFSLKREITVSHTHKLFIVKLFIIIAETLIYFYIRENVCILFMQIKKKGIYITDSSSLCVHMHVYSFNFFNIIL